MELSTAIEAVYEAFSDIEKPRKVKGCPCCLTPEQYETQTAKPLRELNASELNLYASDVLSTVGSEHDFQYFLPRILELTLEDAVEWYSSAEIVAEKMHVAGFGAWDEKKKIAITNCG